MTHDLDADRVVRFFESMTEGSVVQLASIYAADAQFKDPFNDVQGITHIASIYADMFQRVDAPRFVVDTRIVQGDDAFLAWRFLFRMRRYARGEQCIRGSSHLRFNADGLIVSHRDYWDTAEELYEKLPVLGFLMRRLRRAGSAE